MAEKPILFSGEMVRAILDDRKTQTRRVIKFKPSTRFPTRPDTEWHAPWRRPAGEWRFSRGFGMGMEGQDVRCSFGQVGDRLWVRETWTMATGNGQYPVYRADAIEDDSGEREGFWIGDSFYSYEGTRRWTPSIHMPRWASRITLEITGIRVERLQEISLGDLWAESFRESEGLQQFKSYWRDWEANPWVWVIEFEKVAP